VSVPASRSGLCLQYRQTKTTTSKNLTTTTALAFALLRDPAEAAGPNVPVHPMTGPDHEPKRAQLPPEGACPRQRRCGEGGPGRMPGPERISSDAATRAGEHGDGTKSLCHVQTLRHEVSGPLRPGWFFCHSPARAPRRKSSALEGHRPACSGSVAPRAASHRPRRPQAKRKAGSKGWARSKASR
jgi:hypothetical protein